MTHPDAWTSNGIACFTLMTGAMNTILMKMQFDIVANGTESCVMGGVTTLQCEFNKPWFGVLQVKIGMALCLIYLIVRKHILQRDFLETPLPLHDPHRTHKLFPTAHEVPTIQTMIAIVIPASLDMIQSVFSFIGLLWIPASVYQMSGGSMLIFSAFISVKFMKQHLFLYNYISIALVAIALVLVSIAGTSHGSISPTTSDSWDTFIGMIFILLSRFFYSLNIAIEEYFMTKLHVSPILQAGMEGIWGLILFLPLMPLLSWTSPGTSAISKLWHEDFADTWTKIQSSSSLILLVLLYILSVAAYNVAANWVTKHMSSIVRSMIENGRSLGVWIISLLLFYSFSKPGEIPLGEPWTSWSWLELVGFGLLVYATLAYKRVVRYPCLSFYRDDFAPIH